MISLRLRICPTSAYWDVQHFDASGILVFTDPIHACAHVCMLMCDSLCDSRSFRCLDPNFGARLPNRKSLCSPCRARACDGPIRNAADLAGAIAVVERDPPQKVVNRIGFIAKARIVQQHGGATAAPPCGARVFLVLGARSCGLLVRGTHFADLGPVGDAKQCCRE